MMIGKEASCFQPFLDRLPNNWTTLYKLAKLEAHVFDRVTNDPLFAPMMTASDVDDIIAGLAEHNSNRLSRDLIIALRSLAGRI